MKSNLILILLMACTLLSTTGTAQEFEDLSDDINNPDFMQLPRFEIAVTSGFGYRLESIPDQTDQTLKKYLEGMKTNIVYGGDLIYYKNDKLGIGLTYSLFHTDDNAEDARYYIRENVSTHVIGPMLMFRDVSHDEKWHYGPRVALTYIRYENKATIYGTRFGYAEKTDVDFNANSVGLMVGYSAMRKVSKHFGIGFGTQLILGLVGTENNPWQDGAQKEDLSRIEFNIRLHYLK